MTIDRRGLLVALAFLAGAGAAQAAPLPDEVRALYGPVPDRFNIPAVNLSRIGPAYLRARVPYPTNQPAGTVVIDPKRHYLYFVNGDGTAMRYGVGVGRQGFAWNGVATINSKQEWPDWYPPKEMLERQPELMEKMRELRSGIGMPGGPRNPLGARAMYLWQNNKDTLFRIHGTTEPWTIGTNASSGCIRMINQDAIDLYSRVQVGAKVVVLGSGAPGEVALGNERQPARPVAQQLPQIQQQPIQVIRPPVGPESTRFGARRPYDPFFDRERAPY